jgi:hypothetical protein
MIKPSEVMLLPPLPLVDTFGRVEREAAATLLIRACVRNGDTWQSITQVQIGEALRADLDEKIDPVHALRSNPFWRPVGFRELVTRGFAVFDGDPDAKGTPIRFTDNAIALLEKWKRAA